MASRPPSSSSGMLANAHAIRLSMANKNILLIEPGYRNKYPPLGLMKIAQYHGPNGTGDNVRFVKGEDKSVLGLGWDRVYVTTLFSFEWQRISRAIDFALEAVRGQAGMVFVGGIAASLMKERFVHEPRWRGIRFISGLLDKAPAVSLQLDEFEEEIYADDTTGTPIEELVPDYSILDQITYKYPVRDAYFLYASRGCIRKCHFCGVPKLEGGQRDTPSLTRIVHEINRLYGQKKDLIFMDNNVVASARFKEIIDEIVDLGFGRGATITKRGLSIQRRVDFNQGVDARILSKDPMYLRELARICINPLRIAFDHLGVKKVYEKSIRMAADNGLKDLSNYMLYNFHDDPHDLFERMRLNVALNEELGIRIFSFPMRYQPVDMIDRSHVGPRWTRYQLRSMQVILQATHGIVSGAPNFFKQAFGDTVDEFDELLIRPHQMVFNRMWFERGPGRGEFDEYQAAFRRLSDSERKEMLDLLSDVLFDLPDRPRLGRTELRSLIMSIPNRNLQSALQFHVPPTRDEEQKIWEAQRAIGKLDFGVDEDLLVEDAGLDDEQETQKFRPRLEKNVA